MKYRNDTKPFAKITESLVEDILNGKKEAVELIPDSVARLAETEIQNYIYSVYESLVDCESPIEQLLAIELSQTDIDIPGLVDVVAIESNYEVKCRKHTYRVDFMIPVIYWNDVNCAKNFVIECDGYEFHQKTKDQVEKDNQRMRDLQAYGCEVIRFSGTEIFHRPAKCALEVKRIIQAPAIEFIKAALKSKEGKLDD